MCNKFRLSVLLAVGVALCLCTTATAHDANIATVFIDVGEANKQLFDHYDANPFKGFAYVTVTNNSSIAWADFHFEIMSLLGSDVSNVDIVSSPAPTTSQNDANIVIDNDPNTGSTLDYYFWSDPVQTGGDVATFTFYTDNTADQVNFILAMWPTPIPEPAALVLLGVGGAALLLRRRKR